MLQQLLLLHVKIGVNVFRAEETHVFVFTSKGQRSGLVLGSFRWTGRLHIMSTLCRPIIVTFCAASVILINHIIIVMILSVVELCHKTECRCQ